MWNWLRWSLTRRVYRLKKVSKWVFQKEERKFPRNTILYFNSHGQTTNVFVSSSQFCKLLVSRAELWKLYILVRSCCQCFTSSAPAEHISLYTMTVFSKSNHADSLHDGRPNLCSVMHYASPRGNLQWLVINEREGVTLLMLFMINPALQMCEAL